jgi:hypothetical protein
MRGAYGQWSAWLTDFASANESELPDALPPMRVEDLGSRAASRLCQRCVDALNQRLQLWTELFSRDLQRAKHAGDVRLALSSARVRVGPMRALVTSPLLLEELRVNLDEQFQRVLDEAQQDLERGATFPGREHEALLRLVRELPLNRAVAADLLDSPARQPDSSAARRVLIG